MAGQSFKFWTSYLTALESMDDATAGRVVKALCRSVFYDEQPDFSDNALLGAVFEVMREQATTSRELSDKARERGANGGRKSGESRRASSTASSSASTEKRREEKTRKDFSSSSKRKTALAADAAPGGASPAAPGDIDLTVPPRPNIKRPEGLPTLSQLRGTPPPTK